ncbi:DUF998 domain-containing protein [Thalassomonas viridans]|uniref:DUF998 domain-containing protein n=1 Tax=Thalassomonas viridans TaxID=137584 RepID=A0AAE9Z7U8_9GAMM|nr:DUF998 domain-containing protein [Thalassomonas viridans]WDE06692.1 DUF998 domain-containing protein [Thalassomonas viridans]
MIESFYAYSGLLASVWIVFGVLIAASRYQGYSHARQFCSELGASGSPTEKFSPLINNYPLGILFCTFGYYLAALPGQTILLAVIGGLVILHGLGTLVAGFFPMDADPYTKNPTTACKIHSWAGFIMLLSFYLAPVLVLFEPGFSLAFKLFSLICFILSVYFTVTLAKAIKRQSNPGTHQRLSYGAQLLWLSGLSIVVA